MKKCFDIKIIIGLFFISLSPVQGFAEKKSFIEWQSPIPRFADLNLDVNEVSEIAGDGLFLLMLNGKDIELWTKGRVRTYEDARITVAATVLNAPVSVIRSKVLDFASMPDYMPQISNALLIKENDTKSRYLAEWVQTYSLPFFELKAKFVIQHDLEASGDISGLLLEGDIDAGAFRWEFIPISEKQTLVVHSYWGDQKSAGLAFKIFMAAQPEFELSMGAITPSVILTHLKNEIDKAKDNTGQVNKVVTAEIKVPLLKDGKLPHATVKKLSQQGRLVLASAEFLIHGESKPIPLRFVSAIAIMPESPEKLIPFATDYPRMAEYLRYYRKLTVAKEGDKELVDARLKINIGPLFIRVNSQFLTQWNKTRDVQFFTAKKGSDLYPFTGAMEFLPIREGQHTLMVYTMALDINDDAGWVLRKGKELQEYALLMSLHQVITLLDKQQTIIQQKQAKKDD